LSKRRSSIQSKWNAEDYDPTSRHLAYEFTEECQYELLSEFDTEEARLLRQMEEEVFDLECESEEYDIEYDQEEEEKEEYAIKGAGSPLIPTHTHFSARSPINR
jgi:DNA polymerase III delta prime subunit